MGWGYYPKYVSVAERRRKSAKAAEKLKKKGQSFEPINIDGRVISKTFWGKAWCQNLESYSDYSNRLPRGRTYVRNGSVLDLQVKPGEINALVAGSSLYRVNIVISKVDHSKWNGIVNECAGKIDSLIELLQGKFSKAVMQIITEPSKGLFPHPNEIKLNCSCPDWAEMCKHVAATLYGVGARLDNRPEDLFLLRQANHIELISKASTATLIQTGVDQSDSAIVDSDLSSLFGIDIGDSEVDKKPGKIKKTMTATKKRKLAKKKKPKIKTAKTKSTSKTKTKVKSKKQKSKVV